MSDIEKYNVTKDIVLSSEYDFKKLATVHGAVNFEKEASFATQTLKNNNYLCGIAYQNPDSLKMAVVNVAAIGLTLNPVRALAYLVPRDGKVSLDVSYRGYLQLAIDSGAILWGKAEIVYSEDVFVYNGMGAEPTHNFNPFGNRGEIVGAYCAVKTPSKDYLVEMMPISDIHAIRDRSKSWIAYKKKGTSCPWTTDAGEMIKKTVIRRAYKTWPIPSDNKKRIEVAMETTSEDHEIDVTPMTEEKSGLIIQVTEKLELLGKDLEKTVEYLTRLYSRKVESIESLTVYELQKFIIMLDTWIANMPPKEEKSLELDETKELELETIEEENND